MILVFGKKDKELIADAAAYVLQAGKNFYYDGYTNYKTAVQLDNDCQRICKRFMKILKYDK